MASHVWPSHSAMSSADVSESSRDKASRPEQPKVCLFNSKFKQLARLTNAATQIMVMDLGRPRLTVHDLSFAS